MNAAASIPGKALHPAQHQALREILGTCVRFDEPMAPRTSMRVGGRAAAYAAVEDVARLTAALELCERGQIAWTVIGLGSNLLVRDEGFAGVIVRLTGEFTRIAVHGVSVRAGGAAPIAALCREAARAGLGGAEALVGIPGTVGGAIRMNAGTKIEIGALVRQVHVLVAGSSVGSMTVPDFAYRSSTLDRRAVVCSADLQLEAAQPAAVQARLREHIQRRNATQPLELPNAGSIFRNPPGDFAARLIEAAGCKGMQVGGAAVSPKHANFIVNLGGATCSDVLALIEHVRNAVKQTQGVELQTEVQVL